MKPKSFVENAAYQLCVDTLYRPQLTAMTGMALVGAPVAGTLVPGTGPKALAVGFLVLGALVMALVVRYYRPTPTVFGFDLPSQRGISTPAWAIGVPVAILVVFGALALSTLGTNPRQALIIAAGGGVVAGVLGVFGAATIWWYARRWKALAESLKDPDVLEQFQRRRADYPANAPFPFAASTDGLTIPDTPRRGA